MTGRVVWRPANETHNCAPPTRHELTRRGAILAGDRAAEPPGTIWQCAVCKAYWIAQKRYLPPWRRMTPSAIGEARRNGIPLREPGTVCGEDEV